MDEQVPTAVADGLRRRGVDALTVHETDMLGASDPELLALATREERVLFTQDSDVIRLHFEDDSHAGIVYCHQKKAGVGEIVYGL